jgi:hypothetical protein
MQALADISVADKHCTSTSTKNRRACPAPNGSNQALQLLGRGSAGCLGEMPCLNFADKLLWYSFVLAKRRRWLEMGFEGRRLQRRQAWQVSSARGSWILIGSG